MVISGFTFCRNLVSLDYPFLESIQSLLPIVDELVVVVGDSTDGTLEAITKVQSRDSKIRIISSIWDPALFDNGKIFSQQTNLALSHVNPQADWAIHLQSDELLHENDYEGIVASLKRYRDKKEILGLMFRQKYFYGDYWHTNPWTGRRLLRIVRPNGLVQSVGDSSGFARTSDGIYIEKKQKHLWRYAEGILYHYGFVNTSKKLQEKIQAKAELYHQGNATDEDKKRILLEEYQPENMSIMKPFTGTHPRVLSERVNGFPVKYSFPNRWKNPAFYAYVLRHGFKG